MYVYYTCMTVGTGSGCDTINVHAVQLYWGAKSELGEVVTRLSEVYESAKRAAVTRLRKVGLETVTIGNGDVNTGGGQFIVFLPRGSSSSHTCEY